MPNFDVISQSTAKIKLLPASENGRPPYWYSISSFHFEVCVVIRAREQRYSRQGGLLKWGRLTASKMSLDDV